MPNPFWSALMPSLSSSAAGGAAGALRGQIEGPQIATDLDLKQAQAEWQRAHAAHYGHQFKAQQEALGALQAGLAKDPNYLNTQLGRLQAYTYAKGFDPMLQDARVGATNMLGYERGQHGLLYGDQGSLAQSKEETENATRQPKVESLESLVDQRSAAARYSDARSGRVEYLKEAEKQLLEARARREKAVAEMQQLHGKMFQQRTEALRLASDPKTPQQLKGKYLAVAQLTNQIESMLMDPNFDPEDPMSKWRMEMAQTQLKAYLEPGPEIKLGGATLETPFAVRGPEAGNVVQPAKPEVPAKKGMFFGETPKVEAIPRTPTTSLPKLPPPASKRTPKATATPAPTPSKSTSPALPGGEEREQASLAARKLIKDIWGGDLDKAERELKTNKKLTYTEKLALRTEIDAELDRRRESAR